MPKPKKNKGIAPIAIVIVVGAIAAAIGGLFLLNRQGAITLPGTSLIPRATEADFAFIDDPLVRKHLAAQSNQLSYRTKTYSEAADRTFVAETQIKGEDFNTRNIDYNSKNKELNHRIELGNTIYVKDYSDGAWWKQTFAPQELEEIPEEEKPAEPTDFKEEYSKPDLKFNALGKEVCGNLMCYKYEQTTGGPEGMAFKRTFWFDDQKYLLRKEESTVGEFGATIEYSYDNINIVAPSPTKDVPEGRSIYDYYYGAPAAGNVQNIPDYPQDFPDIPYQDYDNPDDYNY